MMQLFAAVERTPLSIWVREDDYAFFWIITAHAFGMALLVGGGMAVALRASGLARGVALRAMAGFFPLMWIGLALAVASGLLLLLGYPAKALTNPVFAVKFALLISAGLLNAEIARRWTEDRTIQPQLGQLAFACWAGGVVAGKFLPYTHHLLLVS